ncbi:MAG TPA: peptidylprolyl isomerase, partial [Longimicrobiales bacterium]|nr:peptidylprolyl isomerase [Longimicrobiales bacterium]
TPDRARQPLTDGEIDAVARVLRLEDSRTWDPALGELARNGSPEVRRRAVAAAGRLGDPAARPLLLTALASDPSMAVRADAAFALGEFGDTSRVVVDALRNAVPLTWAPVRAEDTALTVEIVAALGKLGTPEAGRMVAEALRRSWPGTGRHSRLIAGEALLAAWKGARPETRISSITPFLDVPDPALRWRAAYALMRMGAANASADLLRVMARVDEEEHRIRAYAARGLSHARTDSVGRADTARALLEAALDDEHPHVRINAISALSGYPDAPMSAMEARLQDRDANVAIAAAGALGRMGHGAVPSLGRVAENPVAPVAVRGAALTALGALDTEQAVEIAGAMADAADWHGRYQAARALATIGASAAEADGAGTRAGTDAGESGETWAAVAELLAALAEDADDRVAVAALESAGAAGARLLADERAGATGQRVIRDVRQLLETGREGARRRQAADGVLAVLDSLAGVGTGAGPRPARTEGRDAAFYRDIVQRYVAGPLATGSYPRAVIRTDTRDGVGEIVLELRSDEAPLTVANFAELAGDGYYDNGVWHRVVPNFVLQDGAPAGYSEGGPGYAIRDEINRLRYSRGALGMALSGPDTGGSQWFITHSPQPHLDGGYTVFGGVVEGMETADAVAQGDGIHSIRVQW